MHLRKGHDFSGQVLHRGENFFLPEPGHVIHKKTQNFIRLQKYKIALVTKCTKKRLLP
jgi:hypothetical protein